MAVKEAGGVVAASEEEALNWVGAQGGADGWEALPLCRVEVQR